MTTPIENDDASGSFVGIVNGKPSLIKLNSGIEDEAMMTGEVNVEELREAGMTDEEIADAQADLEERILNVMIGDTAKAYTNAVGD